MTVNPDWWRKLRRDFERLDAKDCRLIWTSMPAVDTRGSAVAEFPPSHWTWWRVDDANMRVRINALATKGAKALGGTTEDDWYDRLLAHRVGTPSGLSFVKSDISGDGVETRPNGAVVEVQSVSLDEVVKDCIALCALLESGMTLRSGEAAIEASIAPARKRGRPVKIAEALKAEAVRVKEANGSYRDAASVLYQTKRPSRDEVKNAASVLRQYRAKIAKSKSSPPPV